MIKKLQRKFVFVTMISVIVVLSIIMILVNVMNYAKIEDDVDSIIEMLAENDGKFPKPGDGMDMSRPNKKPMFWGENHISEETPYETRYFTALVNRDDKILWTNTGNVAAISVEEANEYVEEVLEKDKIRGYEDNYRYFVKENDRESLVIFVDCSRQLATAKTFLKMSVLISIGGTFAVFLMVLFWSYRIMKPIAQSYEKQKRFITDSSHEIKTPLAVISANTEVIEMTQGENEWTLGIKKQVDRLTSLTGNLTSLARMDEDGVKISKERFNISDAVLDVASSFEVLAKAKNRILTYDVEENLEYVGEEKSIRQLVSILMDNAVKYSLDTIKISLKKHKGRIKLEVYNTAENVDKSSLNNYFDRFYRADESRSKEIEGFGIGLSIARSVVDLHKGKISAKSEDGKSLTITVML